MIKIYKTEEEWLADKKDFIGGTGISSIMGHNEFESPLLYFNRKKGLEPNVEQNDMMLRGKFLEDGVVKWFLNDYPEAVRHYPKENGIPVFFHPTNERLGASPDEVVTLNGYNGAGVYMAEVKTTIKNVEESEDLDIKWLLQLNWGIGMAKLNGIDVIGGYFVVLTSVGFNLRIFPYEFDQELFDIQVKAGEVFLDMLDNNEAPDPIHHGDFDMIGIDPNKVIYASEKIMTDARRLKEVKDEMARLEKEEDYLKISIKKYIGTNEFLHYSNGDKMIKVASFKFTNGRDVVNAKKLKEEEPEIYAKYTDNRFYRQLRVTYNNL